MTFTPTSEGWNFDMDSAPKGDDPKEFNGPPILVAARTWAGGEMCVGEAFWYAGDQAWYWANLDSEYGSAIYPAAWQAMPLPPVGMPQ